MHKTLHRSTLLFDWSQSEDALLKPNRGPVPRRYHESINYIPRIRVVCHSQCLFRATLPARFLLPSPATKRYLTSSERHMSHSRIKPNGRFSIHFVRFGLHEDKSMRLNIIEWSGLCPTRIVELEHAGIRLPLIRHNIRNSTLDDWDYSLRAPSMIPPCRLSLLNTER